MKPVFFWLVFLTLIVTTLSANNLSILENNEDCLRMHFSLDTYHLNLADASAPVKMQDEQANLIINNYNLPMFTYMVQVPDQHRAIVRISSPHYESLSNVSLTKTDSDIAVSDEYVLLSEPFVMRGNLLATLAIQPFLYKAGSGRIETLESADIEIEFVPDRSFALAKATRQTKEYKSWLSRSVLNYRDTSREGEANGSLLIIYNATASPLSIIQPLIDWKHQKGWEVHTASTATAGSSTTAIKAYIQNAYNTWENPPEYILILGRSIQQNIVPTYSEYYNHQAVGDYKYTLLDGSDLIPDAFIGRLSYSSSDQLTTMINRIIAYEKQVGLTDSDWYNKALLIADPTQSGISCNTTIEYIRDLMLSYNPTTTYTYANSGSLSSVISAGIAQGVSNFHYRGHNGYSGLTNNGITAINNNGKYPFISFITCFSGNFGSLSTTCPGESFMRSGSATVPKGAIGFVGASCETHTCLNNIMMGGLAYGLYNEGLTSQGQATVRAKLALKACYPQDPANYLEQNFQSVNLLGDPSVDIWLKQPVEINANFPPTVRLVNGELRVTVTTSNGSPVEGAKVCLLKGADEIFQVGYTNVNGIYTFEWSEASAGTAKLTITKPNFCTFIGTVNFASSVAAFTINNPEAFSQLSAGATYTIPVTITNNQYASLTNVTASLVSASDYVIITSPTQAYGSMNLNQSVTPSNGAVFMLKEDCPQGELLEFTLQISGTDNGSQISYSIPFNADEAGPNLTILSLQMGTDNVLTPGETSPCTITIKNLGTATASGVTALLYTYDPNLTINPANMDYNAIAVNQSVSNSTPFTITASGTIYIGTQVMLRLQVEYNNGASQILSKTITIGNVTSAAMTGPDEYGYICIANNDNHPLARPYNWVELNPSQGGSGTVLSMTDNSTEGSGSWQTVSLPAPFRYYGVLYNQMTICSNGFIMPGSAGSQEWMNWEIPGPMVPRPIIAPFWDDLIIQASSKILFQNDLANQRYIVEWSGLKNRYSISVNETFEVIIYYADSALTPTGDHPFLFQYQTFNNIDAGNYGVDYVDHGQYATVGIADNTGNVGLEYTFNNSYPASGTTLSNGSTLFFSTIQHYSSAPVPLIQSYSFTELTPVYDNNQIDCGETISLIPVIANRGFTLLPESTLLLTSTDPYVTISAATSTLTGIEPQGSAAVAVPFVFSIAPNCPNDHLLNFDLSINAVIQSFNLDFNIHVNAPQVEFGSLYINGMAAYYLETLAVTPATLRITNQSSLPVTDGVFTLNTGNIWTAIPAQINVSIPAYGFTDISFSLQAQDSAPIGEQVTISGQINVSGTYDSLFTYPVYVGTMDALELMNCDNPDAVGSWTWTQGIFLQPSTYINHTGMEFVVMPSGSSEFFLIYSPVIFARDSQLIQMKFNYFNQNNSGNNEIHYSIDQSPTWQSLMAFNTPLDSVAVAEGYISDLPDNIQSIRFRWLITINDNDNFLVALDDFSIRAIHHPLGYITGTVGIEGNPADITLTSIYTSELPGVIIHPDESGHYSMPLYQGNYTLHAELDKHLPGVLTGLNVQSSQTLSGIDFNLGFMQKPVNLTYQIQENTLNLAWQLEELTSKSPDRSIPDFYKVFISFNGFNISDTTSVQSYERTVEPGSYRVYVRSVFLDDLGGESYSDSSNTIEFVYTDAQSSEVVPSVFALHQNYPNPFNPTTLISYSLKTQDMASLRIFNVKGQCVRTLVHAQQKQGSYQIMFDGLNDMLQPLSSGIYYYRLSAGKQTITRKMVLLK